MLRLYTQKTKGIKGFRMKKLLLCFLAIAMVLLCACSDGDKGTASGSDHSHPNQSNESAEPAHPSDMRNLTVYFIDVGQGDSIFIELPNGESMLIDAGEADSVGRVISLIDKLGYKKIDYLVATHPHSDHIGGMSKVLEMYEIGKFYMPSSNASSQIYLDLLEQVDALGKKIIPVAAGLTLAPDSSATISFMGPRGSSDNLNNRSAMMLLTYGEKSFYFTGDAEEQEEMLALPVTECDVLKVAHHGSSTSSTERFLQSVKPKVAVISVGKDNEYGHPHQEVIDRLKAVGCGNILRTDELGTIKMVCDGKEIKSYKYTQSTDTKWILNLSGMKVHKHDCEGAKTMSEKNRAYTNRSIAELEKIGYTACGSCNPKD